MVAQSNLVAYYMALRGIVSTSNKSPRPTQQQKEEVQEKKFEQKKEEEFSLFEMSAEEEAKHEEELQRRADENVAKKKASGKVAEVLKSAVIIDVKPWEDTTDMMKMEELVRGLQVDGLEWKASKLVAIGYGIKKLQISCHIVDDLVSIDDIQEKIQEFEDYVQSTDVVAFTKL